MDGDQEPTYERRRRSSARTDSEADEFHDAREDFGSAEELQSDTEQNPIIPSTVWSATQESELLPTIALKENHLDDNERRATFSAENTLTAENEISLGSEDTLLSSSPKPQPSKEQEEENDRSIQQISVVNQSQDPDSKQIHVKPAELQVCDDTGKRDQTQQNNLPTGTRDAFIGTESPKHADTIGANAQKAAQETVHQNEAGVKSATTVVESSYEKDTQGHDLEERQLNDLVQQKNKDITEDDQPLLELAPVENDRNDPTSDTMLETACDMSGENDHQHHLEPTTTTADENFNLSKAPQMSPRSSVHNESYVDSQYGNETAVKDTAYLEKECLMGDAVPTNWEDRDEAASDTEKRNANETGTACKYNAVDLQQQGSEVSLDSANGNFEHYSESHDNNDDSIQRHGNSVAQKEGFAFKDKRYLSHGDVSERETDAYNASLYGDMQMRGSGVHDGFSDTAGHSTEPSHKFVPQGGHESEDTPQKSADDGSNQSVVFHLLRKPDPGAIYGIKVTALKAGGKKLLERVFNLKRIDEKSCYWVSQPIHLPLDMRVEYMFIRSLQSRGILDKVASYVKGSSFEEEILSSNNKSRVWNGDQHVFVQKISFRTDRSSVTLSSLYFAEGILLNGLKNDQNLTKMCDALKTLVERVLSKSPSISDLPRLIESNSQLYKIGDKGLKR
eukprot:Colp12_sorted_trinity150504_noHs@26393